MKYRIKKYDRGYVVENQKRRWWGKRYWTHYIYSFCLPEVPWYHSSSGFAMLNLLAKIKYKTIENSDYESIHDLEFIKLTKD